MKALKNIIVGFLVSFVGSIPLGYLNVIGFEIYSKNNFKDLILYLVGVIIVEGIIIYATLFFAKKLSENKKLLKFIEIFSIVFMFFLASLFFFNHAQPVTGYKKFIFTYAPMLVGLLLSGLNFIQIPFWLGWNLYLINNKYIEIESNIKFLYVFGTLLGTFFGMLCFVLALQLLSAPNGLVNSKTINLIIPIIFFALGCFQLIKYFRKKAAV